MNDNNRTLGVDPGDKRIGLAISDLSGTIANPLMVISHEKRETDAKEIVSVAEKHDVQLIVVGVAMDEEGELSPSGRKGKRLADMIQSLSSIKVVLWDESGSTNKAIDARIHMGVKRKQRKGHMDELAATIILQDYLNSQKNV